MNEVMEQPYFYARYVDGTVETKGLHTCFLGHKIDHTPGQRSDGVYAGWVWDGRRLIVENDRYGFYQLYYFCNSNEICLSPSIFTLLTHGARRELDYTALSIFLRLGFYIREDTPFRSIKVLPPNARFQWQNGELIFDGDYAIQKPLSISKDKAITKYISLFEQSIQRRLPHGEFFIFPLSGGRDSRHILLELVKQGYQPRYCVTHRHYPPRSDDDTRIAGVLTSLLNTKHIIIEQYASRFHSELRKNKITNMCSDEHVEALALVDYLSGKTKITYDGIGGDTLSEGNLNNPAFIALYKKSRYRELAQRMLNHWSGGEEVVKPILDLYVYEKVGFELAVEALSQELKRHSHAPNPIGSFYFWNRTRREITLIPCGISDRISVFYSPYLDHDLFNFLSALPVDLLVQSGFHTETIIRAYPAYAAIPFEHKAQKNQINGLSHRTKFLHELAVYFFKTSMLSARLINKSYLLPRFLRCCLDWRFCQQFWWIRPNFIIYLLQLEELVGASVIKVRSGEG